MAIGDEDISRRALLGAGIGGLALAAAGAQSARAQPAPLQLRRVVTGHDTDGKAVVQIDEIAKNIVSNRPGHASCVVWSTGEFPADNSSSNDGGLREIATVDPHGTVFRIVQYGPGVAPRNHRTESIDYAVVMSGEIDMAVDGGEVHLRQGDVLVQRGTVHNWINRSDRPCVIAFVLTAAAPVRIGGRVLGATG